jgi:23S rRNA (guanosine2251-2'-O)-methyltransferase
MTKQTTLILDNIRSAHNVGSIFRTADGAGVDKIYLIGTTPAPRDRFGREVAEIKKTSLGAFEFVPWEQVSNEDLPQLIDQLRQDDISIVAVEQTDKSILLDSFSRPDNVAYILGNEIDGVGKEWLQAADSVVEIPMKGQKESLNVSVTAGIILFKTPN